MNVGQFIKQFGQNLWAELQTVFSAIGHFFTSYFSAAERIASSIDSICSKVEALVKNVETEVQAVKDFKFDPKWKSRVINVPTAIDKTREFFLDTPAELKDLFKSLAEDLRNLVAGLKDRAGEIGGVDVQGTSGSGLIKVVVWLEVLQEIFDRIEAFIDSLQVIVDDIKKIIHFFETLDTIFLQQGNPRVRLKKTISARQGKLHA